MDASELRAQLGKRLSSRSIAKTEGTQSGEKESGTTEKANESQTRPEPCTSATTATSAHDVIAAWREESVARPTTTTSNAPTPVVRIPSVRQKTAKMPLTEVSNQRVSRTIAVDDSELALSYVRLQEETIAWIETVLGKNVTAALNIRGPGGGLHELLRSGCVLCRLANRLSPGAVRSYNEPGSYSTAVAPLSERENITSFIRACRDTFQLSEVELFSVGDLQNRQGLSVVFATLRALATTAEGAHGWPSLSEADVIVITSGDSGKLRMATALQEAEQMDDRMASAVVEINEACGEADHTESGTIAKIRDGFRVHSRQSVSTRMSTNSSWATPTRQSVSSEFDEFASIRKSLSQTLSRVKPKQPSVKLEAVIPDSSKKEVSKLNCSNSQSEERVVTHHSSFDSNASFASEASSDSFGDSSTGVRFGLGSSPQTSPKSNTKGSFRSERSGHDVFPSPKMARSKYPSRTKAHNKSSLDRSSAQTAKGTRVAISSGYEDTPERWGGGATARAPMPLPTVSASASKPTSVPEPTPSKQPVLNWLEQLKLQQYWPALESDGWDDLETFVSLTAQDLQRVGIQKRGHVVKILQACRQLNPHQGGDKAVLSASASVHPNSTSQSHYVKINDALKSRTNISIIDDMTATCGSRATTQNVLTLPGKPEDNAKKWRSEAGLSTCLPAVQKLWQRVHEMRVSVAQVVNGALPPSGEVWAPKGWGSGSSRRNDALRRYGNKGVQKDTRNSDPLAALAAEISAALLPLRNTAEMLTRCLVPFDVPIVIDIGWNTLKIGFAWAERPFCLRPLVGRLQGQESLVAVGESALQQSGRGMGWSVRPTLHRGVDMISSPLVAHFDDLEHLLKHAYSEVLRTDPRAHPVLVTQSEALMRTPNYKERVTTLLFDTLRVPVMAVEHAAPLVLHSMGMQRGVVLDCGHSGCSATAVLRHSRVGTSVVQSRVAGHELSERMMRLLVEDGHALKSVFEAKRADGYIHERAFLEIEIARAIKEQVCFVSKKTSDQHSPAGSNPARRGPAPDLDTPKERCVYAESLPPHLQGCLPRIAGGTPYLNLGRARTLVPEALFDPSLIRRDEFYRGGSLQNIVRECVATCPEVESQRLWTSVVLVGGTSHCPGIQSRLLSELVHVSPDDVTPQIIAPSEREQAAWRGGALAVGHPGFQRQWVSRAEFLDLGLSLVETRCEAGAFPLADPERDINIASDTVAAVVESASLFKGILYRCETAAQNHSIPKGQDGVLTRSSSTPLSEIARRAIARSSKTSNSGDVFATNEADRPQIKQQHDTTNSIPPCGSSSRAELLGASPESMDDMVSSVRCRYGTRPPPSLKVGNNIRNSTSSISSTGGIAASANAWSQYHLPSPVSVSSSGSQPAEEAVAAGERQLSEIIEAVSTFMTQRGLPKPLQVDIRLFVCERFLTSEWTASHGHHVDPEVILGSLPPDLHSRVQRALASVSTQAHVNQNGDFSPSSLSSFTDKKRPTFGMGGGEHFDDDDISEDDDDPHVWAMSI